MEGAKPIRGWRVIFTKECCRLICIERLVSASVAAQGKTFRESECCFQIHRYMHEVNENLDGASPADLMEHPNHLNLSAVPELVNPHFMMLLTSLLDRCGL